MEELIVIQIVLDIIIFLILLRFILFGRSKSKSETESSLVELSRSIQELLNASEVTLNRITEQSKRAKDLENIIKKRKEEFEVLVERAEGAAQVFNNALASSSSPLKKREDRYTLVKKLAETGMSQDEITKATGVLKGEVELILNLNQ